MFDSYRIMVIVAFPFRPICLRIFIQILNVTFIILFNFPYLHPIVSHLVLYFFYIGKKIKLNNLYRKIYDAS